MKKFGVGTVFALFSIFMLSVPLLSSSEFSVDSCVGDCLGDGSKEKLEMSTPSPQLFGSSSPETKVEYSRDADPWMKFRVDEGGSLDQYLALDNSPIIFYIDVGDFKPDPTISPKPKLTLRVFDVDARGMDECGPEVDVVIINNHYLGTLTGANEQWSTVTFDVHPSYIVDGKNLVQIFIDTTGSECWAVQVDFGILKIPFNIKVTKIEVTEDIDITKKIRGFDTLITGPIWEKKFDASGKLVDVLGLGDLRTDHPFADSFRSNVHNWFRIRVTVDAWPKKPPSLNPTVIVAIGQAREWTSWPRIHHAFSGWQDEYVFGRIDAFWEDHKLPNKVIKTGLNHWFWFLLDCDFDYPFNCQEWKPASSPWRRAGIAERQELNHTLYVTYRYPIEAVFPYERLKVEYLDIACEWAKGAKTDEEIVARITKSITTIANWTFKVDHGFDHPTNPRVSGTELIEGTKDYGSSNSFVEVLKILCGILGVRVGERSISEPLPFLTVPLTALDGNTGNAYEAGKTWDERDRWVLTDHAVGLYKSLYYDPTFIDNIGFRDLYKNIYAWNVWDEQIYREAASTAEQERWGKWMYEDSGTMSLQVFGSSLPPAHATAAKQSTGNSSDFGLDVDGDGLYNFLVAEAWVQLTEAANYCTLGVLSFNESPISLYTEDLYLNIGSQKIQLYFLGRDIYDSGIDGHYSVDLVLLDENGVQIDSVLFNTLYYKHTEFQGLPLKVTGLEDYGRDVDGDGLFDYLTVELSLSVARASNYSITGTLMFNETLVTLDFDFNFLEVGEEIVYLDFCGLAIRKARINGSYTLDILLSDGIYSRTETHNTLVYSNLHFEQPIAEFGESHSDYGIDDDVNGLYDYLKIEVEIEVTEAGNYGLLGGLYGPNGSFIATSYEDAYLDVGVQEIGLDFDGIAIYRHKVDGSYILAFMRLFAHTESRSEIDSVENAYNTSSYSYTEFERPSTAFTQVYSDYGVDVDANGFYDYLTVEVEVDVAKAGNYTVKGNLYVNGSLVFAEKEAYLNEGVKGIELNFDGATIYSKGVDGPYNLRYVGLIDETGRTVDVQSNAYNTTGYSYSVFQRPPITLTGIFSDHGVDIDANGFYDYLVFEIDVIVEYSGEYEVNARLKDSDGNEIVWASSWTFLNKDVPQKIQLQFDGKYIFGNGIDGPFYVKDLSIYYSTYSLFMSDVYETATYASNEFQKSGIIIGTVTDNHDVPVSNALVYISGVSYDHTNTNGSYKLIVVETGTYTVEVAPPSELLLYLGSDSVDVIAGETTVLDLVLPTINVKTDDIILVADDDASSCTRGTSLPEFASALTANGYSYFVWNETTMGHPPLEVLLDFWLVIWTTGDYYYGAIDYTDAVALQSYVAEGGYALLEGENVGFDHGNDTFMMNVAHAIYEVDDTGAIGLTVTDPTHPVTQGLSTSFMWVTDPPYDDGVTPTNGGVEVICYTGTEWTAVTVFNGPGTGSGSVVYFAFPLYCLPQPERGILVNNSVSWLLPTIHDMAVASVTPSSTRIVKGDSVDIIVTVKNEGTENETFSVIAYYDSQVIGTRDDILLESGGPGGTYMNLTFPWDTTGIFPGNYTLSAEVGIVQGEIDTADNTFTNGEVKVQVYPVAHFTYSPTNPLANQTVTFNATLSTPNGGTVSGYMWDFGDGFHGEGVIAYHSYSKTGTYNVTLTLIDSEGLNNTAWATVTVLEHDVAVLSVTPSTNEICEGQIMNITVIVQNNGNFTETFNVTAYANTTAIQTLTVFDLAPTNQIPVTFMWNTTGVPLGSYTIKAEASLVPEETYSINNIQVYGVIYLIPEFPSLIILPLFIIATLLAVIIYRRRM